MTLAAGPHAAPSVGIRNERHRRPILTVDLEFRGKRYRIEESIREQGASIHPSYDYIPCAACGKTLRAPTRRLTSGRGYTVHCLDCAIKAGLLVRLPCDLVVEAVQRAYDAGVAWA